MTTNNDVAQQRKMDVSISRHTGGAYADPCEVIKDELQQMKVNADNNASQSTGKEDRFLCPHCGTWLLIDATGKVCMLPDNP